MNALLEFQRLINRRAGASTGEIIAITPAGITVSTSTGVRPLRRAAGDTTVYAAGDRVRFTGDTITRRLTKALPVYQA